MKPTRRITTLIAFLLTLLTAASLTSCAPKDAKSIFNDAAAKTGSLDFIHAEGDLSAKLGFGGISMELPMEMELRADNTDRENLIYHMHTKLTIPMLTSSVEFDIYSADGYMYTDIMGEKLRAPAASSLTENADDIAEAEAAINEILDEALTNAEIHEEDGKKRFTLDLPAEQIFEEFAKLNTDSESKTTLEGKRLKITVTVDGKGYIEQLDLDMTFSVSGLETDGLAALLGSSLNFTVTGSINLVDIGEEISVNLPDDLDSYEDMEEAPSLSDALGGIMM
ncbi:MAG: hypothetical protein J6I45_08225 [Clostridia bacterium]|nr:hypothetical protein [Clostridia bacterium]